jgi:protein disulfide-isomerase-like protein
MKSISALLILSIATLGSATEQLDAERFYALTGSSGKNGMVKFYQSWCGHCKSMKPDWDKLANEASDSVFIADVNCGEQEELCEKEGVGGYPTIKYYVDGKEHEFNGGRSFDALNTFVDEKLAAKCTFANDDNECSDRAVKYIAKWSKKTWDERSKETKRLENLLFEEMKSDLKKWVRERVGILKSSLDQAEL